MPVPVTMTYFTDFVSASGFLTKLRVVEETLKDDAFDFWLSLRQAIVTMHRDGGGSKVVEQAINAAGPRATNNYRESGNSYLEWLAGRRPSWIGVPTRNWSAGELRISVNPELGLQLAGNPTIIKLYLRKNPITTRKREAGLHLLNDAFGPELRDGYVVGILDVSRGIFHPADGMPNARRDIMLRSEAAGFLSARESLLRS